MWVNETERRKVRKELVRRVERNEERSEERKNFPRKELVREEEHRGYGQIFLEKILVANNHIFFQ